MKLEDLKGVIYRSWNEKEHQFYYFSNGIYYIPCKHNLGKLIAFSERVCKEFTWSSAESYSGIKDTNDKLVFEGDALKIWIDRYEQKESYIVEDMRELYFEMNREDSYCRIQEIEIIGNIHEKTKGDD